MEPGGTETELPGMARNVFMASMAFFFPLRHLARPYRRLTRLRPDGYVDTPFAHNTAAVCSYWRLVGGTLSPSAGVRPFFFSSRSNGVDAVWRRVEAHPLLLRFVPAAGAAPLYVLVVLLPVDKVFPPGGATWGDDDFCTGFDLVCLRKAFLERGEPGLHEAPACQSDSHHKWLQALMGEVGGRRVPGVWPACSLADVSVQQLDLAPRGNRPDDVCTAFDAAYYREPASSADAFLAAPVPLPLHARRSVAPGAAPADGRSFVYGLLHADDNFLMLHADAVRAMAAAAYADNRAETYWAGAGAIVHVITHCPFFHPREHRRQELTAGLGRVDCVLEACLLIYVERELQRFRACHDDMTESQMARGQARLAELLHRPLFNMAALDRRMDHFKACFRLQEQLDDVLAAARPRGRSKELEHTRRAAAVAALLALLGIVATVAFGVIQAVAGP